METLTLLYQNNTTGEVYDLTNVATQISLDTQQNSAAELQVSILFDQSLAFSMGGACTFKVGDVGLFFGTLFDVDDNNSEEITLIFRDQLFYLQATESYTFGNVKARDVIKALASDFKLRVGTLDDTGYIHEPMIHDSKKLLDIIAKYVGDAMRRTGRMYTFQDSFGSLTLRYVGNNIIPFVVGDKSLANKYKYKRSITDSKNEIKLIQENSDTKERAAFIYKDSDNIRKWGRLLEYQTVDEKLSPGMVTEYGRALLGLKNREMQTLSIEAQGNSAFLAGRACRVELATANLAGVYIIESAKHNFKGKTHTMSLTLGVV